MLSGLLQCGMARNFQRNQYLNAHKSLQRISYLAGFSKVIGVNADSCPNLPPIPEQTCH